VSDDASTGDETRKLIAAVQSWAQRALPEPPSGHGGPECQWCPVCQFASILRGEHPDVTERVAEVGTALTGAFRALVEAAATHAPPPSHPDTDDEPTPRVQRIDLDDEG
jgi:hypothetical protein